MKGSIALSAEVLRCAGYEVGVGDSLVCLDGVNGPVPDLTLPANLERLVGIVRVDPMLTANQKDAIVSLLTEYDTLRRAAQESLVAYVIAKNGTVPEGFS